MLTHDDPRVFDAGRLLEQLHRELAAEERVEVRYRARGEGGPMKRVFLGSPAQAATKAVLLAEDHDVYVGAATRRGEDGTRVGVCCLRVLWADLDLKGGHTRERRLEQLTKLPCSPSMLVWTGGGFHAYWQLEGPAEDEQEMARAEGVMRLLAEALGGDPVHDRSRIMRVPGTLNHKYGEPRPVTLERYDPDLRYGLDRLGEMAEVLADEADDGSTNGGGSGIPRDVLGAPIREGKRNAALASVAGSLRDRGLDAETICAVLVEVNLRRCEPPLKEAEAIGIGRSVGRYPAGSPRYRRSSAKRIYRGRRR